MGYRTSNIIAKAEGFEKQGVKVFAPILDNRELEEIQDILVGLENRGWLLTHWSVVAYANNSEAGYPVFRYQGVSS